MKDCTDLHGRTISPGLHFVPGPDSCTLCICDKGEPKWCKAVLCSPPQDCKSFRVGNSCCEFICLDDTLGKTDSELDFNPDLGLRLIATAFIAILSLLLLFFLIHRLRQRKIRGVQNREIGEEDRNLGSIGYIAGSLGYLGENHFEEPSGHYSLWKPSTNYFTRGEAPPPYEEAVRVESTIVPISPPGPSVISQTMGHQQHRTIPVTLATSSCSLVPPPVHPGTGLVATTSAEHTAITRPPPPLQPQGVDEVEDYRSECENCKLSVQQQQQQAEGDFEEEDMQTMTLQRRTQESVELQPFYRTSLTLPVHTRKHRNPSNGTGMACARENWFSSMPESSSSSEDD